MAALDRLRYRRYERLNEKQLQLHFVIGSTAICINFIDASSIETATRSSSWSNVNNKMLFIMTCRKCRTESADNDILKLWVVVYSLNNRTTSCINVIKCTESFMSIFPSSIIFVNASRNIRFNSVTLVVDETMVFIFSISVGVKLALFSSYTLNTSMKIRSG